MLLVPLAPYEEDFWPRSRGSPHVSSFWLGSRGDLGGWASGFRVSASRFPEETNAFWPITPSSCPLSWSSTPLLRRLAMELVGTPTSVNVPFPSGFEKLNPDQQGAVVAARLAASITSARFSSLAVPRFGAQDLSGLDATSLASEADDAPTPECMVAGRLPRILFTDLDGTLTSSDGRIPAKVFSRLETLRSKQNVKVIIATGRPVSWARTILATWPVDAVIAENGAVILYHVTDAKDLTGVSADAMGVVEEALFPSSAEDLAARTEMITAATKPASEGGMALRVSPDQPGRVCDVAFELDESLNSDDVTRGVPNAFIKDLTAQGFRFSFSNVHLNVWRGDHTKASGIGALLARLGLSETHPIFIGDSPNDRPCFRMFGDNSYGVASVNKYHGHQARGPAIEDAEATDSLASVCGRVTVSHGAEGWLEAVEDAFPSKAFATLVANEFYVTGAIALAKSLIGTGTRHHLVCLVGPDVSAESADTLASLGGTIVRVPAIAFSESFKDRHALDVIKAQCPYNSGVEKPKKFRNLFNFSKLFLWALTDYERVVYLDADTVVLGPIERLFELPGFAAAHNLHVRWDQLNRINSGVLVLEPSLATLRAMFRTLLDPASMVTYHRTDQTFLEMFWAGRTHAIDRTYNALQYLYVTAPTAWDWAGVKVAHFIMQKPWQVLDDENDDLAREAMKDASAPVPAMPEGLRSELAPLHAVWWAAYRALPGTASLGGGHAAVAAAGEAAAAALRAVAATVAAMSDESKEDDSLPTETEKTDLVISSAAATAAASSSASAASVVSPLSLVLRPPNSKKAIVVGGDGFCGWPLALRLSAQGYQVLIADNLSRRRIDNELGVESLTPIASMAARLDAWKDVTKADAAKLGVAGGRDIHFEMVDVNAEYDRFRNIVERFRPSTIVHLGEQRAAPYSMKDERTRRYTVTNNLGATHAVLNAIVEVDQEIHLVHLGTMGVYGYGAVEDVMLPEGYVDIKMKDRHGEWKDNSILHPAYPGSVYHMTKTQDALFFQFYAKNYKLSITDLHQGIVWGLHTQETRRHPHLINRIDYDSDYGTVLNRFVMQAACSHPLTIYGTGEQTRAFIHIENSMDCMQLAVENPPKRGERVRIYNQMTETHRLLDLAALLQRVFEDVKVSFIDNPRKELVSNDLRVTNKAFLDLGLKPITLESDRVREIYDAVSLYKDRFDCRHVLPKSFW
jgi:UDP-sulfoquinovose synthase